MGCIKGAFSNIEEGINRQENREDITQEFNTVDEEEETITFDALVKSDTSNNLEVLWVQASCMEFELACTFLRFIKVAEFQDNFLHQNLQSILLLLTSLVCQSI